MFPLEFRAEVNRQETRVMGLSSSEDRMIVAGVVLAWYRTVTGGQTDGLTDGQTESIIAKTALCIASYADALSKMDKFVWDEKKQESCATAKMTARCALYMGAMKYFWESLSTPTATFAEILGFCSDQSYECGYKIWSS